MKDKKLIVITGPTATGKTAVAAHLAFELDAEIISADSRQVYRGMDLGTGKDLSDYSIKGRQIPYHLIDIADPGYEYNVFEFQKAFKNAYDNILDRDKRAILCGGSGMYVESVVQSYSLKEVKPNLELRKQLAPKSMEELTEIFHSYKIPHNITDLKDRVRLIRAIEIQQVSEQEDKETKLTEYDSIVFGIGGERTAIRQRITRRLKSRLEEGMVEEVEQLLKNGLTPDALMYYGLEYKFLTQFVIGEIEFDEMFNKLNTAIHQFSKRQMTWFRRMEKKGTHIHWIDSSLPMIEKIEIIKGKLKGFM